MIELELKPYCNECDNFECATELMYADNKRVTTVIVCKNRNLCDTIENYLRQCIGGRNEETTKGNDMGRLRDITTPL